MQTSSAEHFQDGWRCEEGEWQSTVAHWPSESHQRYSPHPPGIVGTGGTGSLLKPLIVCLLRSKGNMDPY